MKNKLFKILKVMIWAILSLVVVLSIITFFYMRQSKFGKTPSGERLEIMEKSPNFKNGQFQNLNDTPQLAEGHTVLSVMYNFLFKTYPRTKPKDVIPSIKTDLKSIPLHENVLIWFGHSSYYLQLDGKRLLVDPVFSGNASPIPGSMKSFEGTDIYHVEDFPDIDYLLISHDHYDHVDYQTLINFKDKISTVICGLGVGAHFESWGYPRETIIEKDWHGSIKLDTNFSLFVEPSRHFSGRGFSRNNTLWVSYVLKTTDLTIYLGGDSGYDTHYLKIGKKHGPFDLAVLENGQYNPAWPYIHHQPEQVLMAARDLGAKRIFPVHSSKFALSSHPWDEPLKEITELNASKGFNIPLVTPIVGERVNLSDTAQSFKRWWVGLE